MDPTVQVSRDEISQLVGRKHFVDQVTSFGSVAFKLLAQIDAMDTALEVSPPGIGHDLELCDKRDSLQLDLLVRVRARSQVEAARFRIEIAPEIRDPRGSLSSVIEDLRRSFLEDLIVEHDECDGILLTELEPPLSRSRSFKRMLKEGVLRGLVGKSFDPERANLTLGLVYWVIHLWNTPWTFDLCSCNIHYVRFPKATTRHSLAKRADRIRAHSTCRLTQSQVPKLILLGTILAEIALSVPISLDFHGCEPIFIVDRSRKSRQALIFDLNRQYGRSTIAKAVKYCFDPANDDFEAFLPEHLEPFSLNILDP